MSRGQSCEISWIFQTKKLGKCRKFKYFLRWGVKVCFNILSVPKIWHFETLTEASSPSVMASNSLVNRSSVQSLYFETYWWSSYTKSQVCQHLFFWRHGPSGKSDITTFSSRVATALKWSTVRGFILTQVDKFALRKYLSRLKLVFASDTGSYTLNFLPIPLLLLVSPSHTQQGISVCDSLSLEFEKLNKGTVIFPIKWFAMVACCEAFEQRFNLWK